MTNRVKTLKIVHLTASPFLGGPERVILDVIRTQLELGFDVENQVISFREQGGCEPLIRELNQNGFNGTILEHDMPHLVAAYNDLVRFFRHEKTNLVCAHGHKSRLLGWLAARRVGIPIVGVSHGWTWQDWKTSLYERLDQWVHRRMDKVVCVSQGQADKVIQTGTPKNRVLVIHNAINPSRFSETSDFSYRQQLQEFFETTPQWIVGAAGRLSPEKGFDVLVEAVRLIAEETPELSFGVVLFGEGFLRKSLQDQINHAGLANRFKMVGFTSELDKFLPHFDLFVQSSRTEGFPCVNLEAMAAGVPVLATAVGGVPEQIVSGETGFLVPPNDPISLANNLRQLLENEPLRRLFAKQGQQKTFTEFTCRKQAEKYWELFQNLCCLNNNSKR
ncbi:MAG: glycosyltransferase family 4 protein [Planctomycetaceae bacterium]|jgi:glycosyltransferase involved in cell wall biosynthesis|nr:glycosyltransferase family 4 protein [Planctomycetaceae bacterium]